jgi:endonuclease III
MNPDNWIQIYNAIANMRCALVAPVDVVGPHLLANPKAEPRFQILIALILGSQTRDQIVSLAMNKLQRDVSRGCLTIQSIIDASEDEIKDAINGVSFHNKKAGYIKGTAEMIHTIYNDKVPTELKELLKLPGVGNKVANLFKVVADEEITNIAIDTHLSRIFKRWKWVSDNASSPNVIGREIQSWLPRPLWKNINQIVVGFGQIICTARNPLCGSCLARHWCPSKEEVSKPSSDIEDMEILFKRTQTAYDKLVEEFGLPEKEAEWVVPNGNNFPNGNDFVPIKTRWLEEEQTK